VKRAASMDHDLVVIIQRTRQTLCTRHHRWRFVDGLSKRIGRSQCSEPNPHPGRNHDQRNDSQQRNLSHVNSLPHFSLQATLIRGFGV
jgi:hypothetical protein